MSRVVAALQREPLDHLVWRATGQGSDAVVLVLAANYGLAAIASELPEGHPVTIPALPANPAERALVQLWD